MDALTNKGTHFCAEASSLQADDGNSTSESHIKSTSENRIKSPEAVGEEAADRLLDEALRGGCVDSHSQTIALLYMALGPRGDVSKIVLGPLSKQT